MKYVGVKHSPEQESVYWFSVPESLSHLVSVGSDVKCNTRRGEQYGKVVYVIDGLSQEDAGRIIGQQFFPLKSVIGIEMDFEVNEIHIPWALEETLPNPEKIAKRVKEFYRAGAFDTNVVCTPDGNLKDGYTAYLVAKMFGHETIHGMCRISH